MVEFLKVPELVREPLQKVEQERQSVAANLQEVEKHAANDQPRSRFKARGGRLNLAV